MENKIAIGTLAVSLSKTTGKSKKLCEDFLRDFFKLTAESLERGENLRIKGFGSFKVVEVESRESVNVNTGERQEIASHKKVVFTPAKELAALINAPFQYFESVEMPEELELFEEEDPDSEDEVSAGIIEAGSDEEAEDDDITLEAYKILEKREGEIKDISDIEDIEIGEGNLDNKEEIKEIDEEIKEEIVMNQNSKLWLGFALGALSMLVVCLIIFIIGCFCNWWPETMGREKKVKADIVQTVIQQPVMEEKEEEVPSEKLEEIKIETSIPNAQEKVMKSEKSSNTTTSLPPAKEQKQENRAGNIYDTVTTTRYLTNIARDHYGNPNLWPYIYMENEGILGHPDRITPGTRVVVPNLAKYGVKASNAADVEKAKRLGEQIYSRYR